MMPSVPIVPPILFMNVQTLNKLRKDGKATPVASSLPRRGHANYAFHNGRRVITHPAIPYGEIVSDVPVPVKDHLRKLFQDNKWPLPAVLEL